MSEGVFKYEFPEFLPVRYPIGGPLPRGRRVSADAVRARPITIRLDDSDRFLLRMVANYCDMDSSTLARWAIVYLCKAVILDYEQKCGQDFPRD